MNIAFDECVPEAMVRVYRTMTQHGDLPNVAIHWARDYTQSGESGTDVPWMERYKAVGGEVVISGDRRIRSRLHEQEAYMRCGLVLYMFSPTWCGWNFRKKSAFLLQWWDRIVEHASSAPRPSCWDIPTSWESGDFKDKTGPLFQELRS